MKKFLNYSAVLLITGLMMAFTGPEDEKKAMSWSVDKSHTSISFEVNHFFTPVKGYFEDYEGILVFNPEDLENSSAEFTVNLNSINTQNEKRDGHLQSEDFFNSAEWPTMKFKSTEFSKSSDGYVMKGELTIREVTKTVEIPFEVLGMQDHPMKDGAKLIGIRASTSIDRTDYGVGTGSYAATAVVGDKVTISVLLEGISG